MEVERGPCVPLDHEPAGSAFVASKRQISGGAKSHHKAHLTPLATRAALATRTPRGRATSHQCRLNVGARRSHRAGAASTVGTESHSRSSRNLGTLDARTRKDPVPLCRLLVGFRMGLETAGLRVAQHSLGNRAESSDATSRQCRDDHRSIAP
jgi:hypothetical protein